MGSQVCAACSGVLCVHVMLPSRHSMGCRVYVWVHLCKQGHSQAATSSISFFAARLLLGFTRLPSHHALLQRHGCQVWTFRHGRSYSPTVPRRKFCSEPNTKTLSLPVPQKLGQRFLQDGSAQMLTDDDEEEDTGTWLEDPPSGAAPSALALAQCWHKQ